MYFATYFSNGCQPSVTTGIVTNSAQRQLFATVSGLGTLHPDASGMKIGVEGVSSPTKGSKGKGNKIGFTFWVSYIAMGY